MKSSEEMISSLLERRGEYMAERAVTRRKLLRTAAPVMALCLVIAGIAAGRSRKLFGHSSGPIGIGTETSYRSADGDPIEGGVNLDMPPQSNVIKFVGERLTDEEARLYFEENSAWIRNALGESGVQVNDFRILDKGYPHINYEGGGKELEVRQNFRDYLAYSGDQLVAIITLVKEDGKLYATPAFGGPWFDSYNELLKAHAGEKLIYLYYGITEVVLLPDGSAVNPMGYSVKQFFEWVKDPYAWFFNEEVVYVP